MICHIINDMMSHINDMMAHINEVMSHSKSYDDTL